MIKKIIAFVMIKMDITTLENKIIFIKIKINRPIDKYLKKEGVYLISKSSIIGSLDIKRK